MSPATSFWQDARGAVAPMLGMLAIPLALFIGLAVDHSRAVNLHTRALDALDAAALAAARAMQAHGASDEEVIATANQFFQERMAQLGDHRVTMAPLTVVIDRANDRVRLDAAGSVETYFARMASVDRLSVSASSTAVFGVRDIEVSLMLDVSGSMDDFGKIHDLKQAAKDFVDILMPGTPDGPRARIALAPYSTAVNAGDYAERASGNGRSNRCVSERRGADAFTDEPPANGRKFGGRPTSCPDAAVLALTDDKQLLKDTVDSYDPAGSTAGHLGIGWAWYLVSPEWSDFWPAESAPGEHDDSERLKAVVLMTDGMFNTEYERAENGSSELQAQRLCEAIKADDVLVFSVAFQAPSEVLPLLRQCATSPSYFFNVATGDELTGAYQLIARKLTQLRLAQ